MHKYAPELRWDPPPSDPSGRGIVLTASEERSVGSIVLSVGSISESVTVPADAVQVQTASVENLALISNEPISNLMARGAT